MRSEGPSRDDTVARLLAELERAIGTTEVSVLQHLLASLEGLKATAWARLLSLARPEERRPAEPLEDLRHFTPVQVADLLGLKAAYVHELCRSRRLPAIKEGKYWMISIAGLRAWIAAARPGIDPASIARVASSDLGAGNARTRQAPGPGGRRPSRKGLPGESS
jgi:hypothetical protein